MRPFEAIEITDFNLRKAVAKTWDERDEVLKEVAAGIPPDNVSLVEQQRQMAYRAGYAAGLERATHNVETLAEPMRDGILLLEEI